MATAFSEILDGRKDCQRLLEDGEFLAFLSETPIRAGHTLVIPKREIDDLFGMEEAELARLMAFAKKTAALLKRALPCVKIGLMAAGIQVRHAHLHLVPIDQPSDLDFSKAQTASSEALEHLAALIKRPVSF